MDDLYSPDAEKCLNSIICIKNSVIGSNRQKQSIIAQGIVPRLMNLLRDKSMKASVRYEAAITIGSLAKGTMDHIDVLLNSGIHNILLDTLDESDDKLVDACLCCLRTLMQSDASSAINYSMKDFQKLLTFAIPEETMLRQSCVTNILSSACKSSAEQNMLCSAGAPQILITLLSVKNLAVRLPTLTCIAAICFENRNVSTEVTNIIFNKGPPGQPNLFVSMLARDRPIDLQLKMAKCVTNLCRAGAIATTDPIVVFRTLSCLIRICQVSGH